MPGLVWGRDPHARVHAQLREIGGAGACHKGRREGGFGTGTSNYVTLATQKKVRLGLMCSLNKREAERRDAATCSLGANVAVTKRLRGT